MTDHSPKPPMPRWFWFVLAFMVMAMLGSLVAAAFLPSPSQPGRTLRQSPALNHRLLPVVVDISPIAPVSPTVTEFPAVPEPAEPAKPAPKPAQGPTQGPTGAETPPATPATLFWQTNSRAAAYADTKGPRLVIILDDMGLSPAETERALNLPQAVTFSFLAYGSATAQLAQQAYNAGHELLVHVPMEPLPHGPALPNSGPNTLLVGDTPAVLEAKLQSHLKNLGHLAVGVNNHMGSRFTAWPEGMREVLTQLNNRGYLFLDSLTITPTATRQGAQGLALPVLKRDVFLDHDPAPDAIARQLERAVALAQKQGMAIAIGHPLPSTLGVLEETLPHLPVTLVPLTTLLSH